MPHEWIMQVLSDLQDYAIANGLPAIAEMAAEGLVIAKEELALVNAVAPPRSEGLH